MGAEWHDGLATTKVHPPLPPTRLVRRPRLLGLLDDAVDSVVRLVLVSAPAGSGKSTMLAPWVAGRTEAVAWLQAEESDSDPVCFWTYLIRAIATSHPIGGDELKALVAASNGDDLIIVSALVNELAGIEHGLIVVIDDHHLIVDASVQRGLERFIDLCPSQVTLVIATRFDPPFRLGRLRVRGQMTEIRVADLRFDLEDVGVLLGPAARVLDASQLETLCRRTEGWAAGLVLAGISLGRVTDTDAFIEAFRGDDHLVVEYLRDELLAGLGPTERRHLLETSILEQLHGELVDAVTGSDVGDGAKWLRGMANENQLLIALDHTATWFRYHHLLRDLLRLEAAQEIPARIPGLHAQAASWFETQGQYGPVIAHRLAAGEPAEAARLLRVHGPRLLAEGQIDTLRGLLVQLGDVAHRDLVRAAHGMVRVHRWPRRARDRLARSDGGGGAERLRPHRGRAAAHEHLARHRRCCLGAHLGARHGCGGHVGITTLRARHRSGRLLCMGGTARRCPAGSRPGGDEGFE